MDLSYYKRHKIYEMARIVAEIREDEGSVLIPDDFVNGVKWVLKYLEAKKKKKQ